MYQTIVEAVLEHGAKTPDKLAIAFKNNRMTYGELCNAMKQLAYELKTKDGIIAGDKVMLTALSKPDYVVAMLAIQFLGATSVPVDKVAKADFIVDVYEYIHPKLLLSDASLKRDDINQVSLKGFCGKKVEDYVTLPDDFSYVLPHEDTVAELLFTTGTTGKPKGAMLSFKNVCASTKNTWHGVNMQSEDVVLIPLPLNHSFAMRVLRTALYVGATIVLQNGFTFAKELENNINTFNCTALASVAASMEMVYRQMQDKFADILGKLRYIEFGAGSVSYDMKKKLTSILPNTVIYNTWGSTETGGAIFLNVTKRPDKLTSLGKPIDGVDLKVVNEQGEEIVARDIDTAGRMVLRGDMQMLGYYNMPDVNAETLVDGWLYTNDIVYTDDEGYVYMLGRADDIINVGGEKVSPIEVENIAQEHEQIRDCACIGVPDEVMGQVPILYVVPEGMNIETDLVTKFLAEKMEKYKLPHQYIMIDELPRNKMKKLDRKALHRLYEERGTEDLMNSVMKNILNRHSIRDFQDVEIPKAKLEMILKAGMYAPSGHNMQTWRFTVVKNPEKIKQIREITRQVAKRHKVHFYGFNNPETLILISNDRRNPDGIQDSSCAAENMMLAACSYGIGSVWLNALHTICDEPEIREMLNSLNIPKEHIVWCTLAMGYPLNEAKVLAKKTNVVEWVE